MEKTRATLAAERTADLEAGTSVEVAPGVFLPENEGMYVVEGGRVTAMAQSTADVKLDKGRLLTQVLVPIPVVPTRHKVQVPGKRAELRLTTSQPEFYLRTEGINPDRTSDSSRAGGTSGREQEPELDLIRAEVKGDARLIELLSTEITGQRSAKRKAISVERWTIARGVYRITLSQPLEPGEYALAEILPQGMNLYVWDFGVDPPTSRPGTPEKRPGQARQKQ